MKLKYLLLLAVFILGAFVGGCGPKEDPSTSVPKTVTPSDTSGASKGPAGNGGILPPPPK